MTGYRRGGRLTAAVAMGATALLALAACSSPSSSSSTSASAAAPSASASASAPAAAALPAASPCADGSDPATTFKLGTFLPLTGSLKSLGPAAVAGAGTALSDINAAGGVNGKPACVISTDSSDKTQPTIGLTNVKKLLADKVSAILGAESSSVTENVLPTVAANGTVMFSPANTDDALSGASKWYFRDAPPNSVEGSALGKQIAADGHTKVGFLVFNDSYGTNLRDSIQKALVAAGATVTYGGTGKKQEFPAGSTNFTSEVQSILATKPDAIVIDAFAETYQILPALKSAGWDMSKLYFVDGNLANYNFDANGKPTTALPDLTGAKGSIQGVNPDPAQKAKFAAWYKKNEGATLTGYSYAAESYDAVMILALAANVAGSSSSAAIQKEILPVTGTTNGTVCTTYADCLTLIKAKKSIHYQGPSSIGPLNALHDPSSGYISIYQYVGKNYSKFLNAVKG